jgi:cell volume regulation protein A
MFLTLGLLADPSNFPAVAGGAIALAAFLIIVARPLAVWLCLFAFGFSRQEMAFVSWVGLRGAVSILLATLPIIAGLHDGSLLFNVTFIVVLASLLVQGWTIGPVARFLGLVVPGRSGPVDRIELELPGRGNHEIVAYVVHPDSPVAKGERIPRWARPSLVIRDGRALRPHRFGRPEAGDQIYVITTPEYIGLLDRLFAAPERPGDPELYGEFALEPDIRLSEVAQSYPLDLQPGDAEMTIGAYLRRELAGNIEPGDRVAIGAVDFIVRRVTPSHEIEEVGLAMEQSRAAPPRIPLFQTPREIAALIRAWRSPPRPQPRVPEDAPSLPPEPGPDSPPDARP